MHSPQNGELITMTEPCPHPKAKVFGAYRDGALDAWCRACGQHWTDPDTAPAAVLARIYELQSKI